MKMFTDYSYNYMSNRISKKRQQMGEEAWAEYQKKRITAKTRGWQARNAEKYVNYRREVKRRLIAYKGGKCERCGYDKDCPAAFHFHHNDPSQKEFSLGHRSLSFETKVLEVEKCQLLCACCHAEIHDELFKKVKEDTIKRLQA